MLAFNELKSYAHISNFSSWKGQKLNDCDTFSLQTPLWAINYVMQERKDFLKEFSMTIKDILRGEDLNEVMVCLHVYWGCSLGVSQVA